MLSSGTCVTYLSDTCHSIFVATALAPWCGEEGEGTRERDVEDLGSVSVPPAREAKKAVSLGRAPASDSDEQIRTHLGKK